MKKHTLISLALLTMMSSGTAFGHKIYYSSCDDSAEAEDRATADFDSSRTLDTKDYSAPFRTGSLTGIMGPSSSRGTPAEAEKCYSDSPEARELRAANPSAPESDRVAAMAFCKLGGYENAVDCASDVLNKGLVDAAKGCINKLDSFIHNPKINPVAHKLGGATSPSGGVWHFDYRESKDDGVHRHAYSDQQRDIAGRTFAAAQLELEKARRSVKSTTESNTTISGANLGIDGSVSVGVPGGGPGVTLGGSAGVNGGSEKGTSTEKGPLSQKESDELWKKYYEMGKADPQKAGFEPDILCMRNEKNCLTSSGKVIPNPSYVPDTASKKEEEKTGSSSSSHKSTDTSSPKTPSPSRNDDFGGGSSIEVTDGGHWAGEPSKPSDGSMWVDFNQEDPGNDPMAKCIFDAHMEQVKHGSDKTYSDGSADTRSEAARKRDAESLLKRGICDEKYYGREYCTNWRKNFQLIDSNNGPDDKPIPGPGEKAERPGYLHFDPDRVPVQIPDLKGVIDTNPNPSKLPSHLKP
ncbi:hypothetical protein [Oligoflexus tunisiensis]|uniref:hypothetical protein n=1 Tax=Oligoflexus tunisiensis TaxID=708132 RepID=UPI00114D1150|nr:hypothetical protein [Oligoflexus tunisiensis]